MARYIDADKLIEALQTDYDREGAKADDMALRGDADLSVKYSHGQFCYLNAIERIKDTSTADVVPKSEVAREIFEEIEREINDAMQSNYKVLPLIEQSESLWNRVNGKIDALRGIDGFIEELKEKYTEENKVKLKVKLDEGAFAPESAHTADAGYDLRTPTDCFISGGGFGIIDTGVHIAIPEGYVGLLKSKSGLNVRDHLTGEGVIDSGYTGSIAVKLYNNGIYGGKAFKRGDKIIQILFVPIIKPEIELVNELEKTERGDGGFGSTGR